jgi:hypothetical protein
MDQNVVKIKNLVKRSPLYLFLPIQILSRIELEVLFLKSVNHGSLYRRHTIKLIQ